MSETCEATRAVCAGRALGVLEPDEAAQADEHLRSCASCAAFAATFEAALDGAAPEALAAPEGQWEKIARRIGAERGAWHGAPLARVGRAVALKVACVFCHATLVRADAVYCASCLAPHHHECFDEHGRCSAHGCGETRVVRPRLVAPGPGSSAPRVPPGDGLAPAALDRARRPWNAAAAVLVAAAGLGAAAALGPRWRDAGVAATDGDDGSSLRLVERGDVLVGEWDGGDWGFIVLDRRGGTYTANHGTGPGRYSLHPTGWRTFEGTWGESGQRHGKLVLTASQDGGAIDGTWEADAACAIRPGERGTLRWTRRSAAERPVARPVATAAAAVGTAAGSEATPVVPDWTLGRGPLKVLVLDDGPRWEFRRLRDLLRADTRVLVNTWLATAEPWDPQDHSLPSIAPADARSAAPEFFRSLDHAPRPADLALYDVVVIGDVDPARLGGGTLEALERFVSAEGKGIVFVAGEQHGPRAYRNTPLERILPAIPLRERAAPFAEPTGYEPQASPLRGLVALGATPEQDDRLWRGPGGLPGVFWIAPVGVVKPGAEVLVRAHGSDAPIFIASEVGRGRVFQSLVDETWRWRSGAEGRWFATFWRRVLAWTAWGSTGPGRTGAR